MQLREQLWMKEESTQTLLAAFAAKGIALRFVGGCVRDAVMGRTVGDIDCASPAPPEVVMQILTEAHIKAIPTGIGHGTVTAVVSGKPFEITTLRKDVACDGRHAKVEYTDNWQEDALRRDFTLNALYCDGDGILYDYTNGVEAAKARRIEFIGEASARICEDALRILRFFRFSATHGSGEMNEAAINACATHKHMLHDLSGERIQTEMFKLLAAENPYPALDVMHANGLLDAIALPASTSLRTTQTHPILRLALLLASENETAELAARWKLSNADSALLKMLHSHADTDWPEDDLAMIHVARHMRPEHYRLLLARNASRLGKDDAARDAALTRLETLSLPLFPVSGDDLIKAGLAQGPQLGETLRQLEETWEQSGYKLDKTALLKAVKH